MTDKTSADYYFAIVPEWVLDADVSSAAIRLYAVLRRYADRDGMCFPSRQTLAARMRCSDRTVDSAIKELLGLGALEKERRYKDDGGYTSNIYTVCSIPPSAKSSYGGENKDRSRMEENVPTPSEENDTLTIAIINESQNEPDSSQFNNADTNEICNLLADCIARNGFKRPSVTKEWLKVIDRMMRIDGRTPEQIQGAIIWATQDDFWSMNVRSPHKLREHFDRLRLEAVRKQKQSEPRGFSAIREYLEDQIGAEK